MREWFLTLITRCLWMQAYLMIYPPRDLLDITQLHIGVSHIWHTFGDVWLPLV